MGLSGLPVITTLLEKSALLLFAPAKRGAVAAWKQWNVNGSHRGAGLNGEGPVKTDAKAHGGDKQKKILSSE